MSMRSHLRICLGSLFLSVTVASFLFAGEPAAKKGAAVSAVVIQDKSTDEMRVEGERRFRANCGRCHAAPQKFPPRMMATVLRHMRVRATITAEDRQLILFYMTQ